MLHVGFRAKPVSYVAEYYALNKHQQTLIMVSPRKQQ
jgi:hypothetical protein